MSEFTTNTTGAVEYTTVGSVIRTAVVLLVSITIIVSNLLNFVILKTAKQKSNITKVFVTNLTAADFCSGLIACLPPVGPAITGTWPYGATWCQISGVVHRSCSVVSIWTVGVIGVERYIASHYPLFYKQNLTRRTCLAIGSLLWTLGIIMAHIPNTSKQHYALYEFLPETNMSGLHCESKCLCMAKSLLIPLLSRSVIIFTTTSITKALRTRERKAIRLLIVTMSLYILTWGPYAISTSLKTYGFYPADWFAFTLMWTANSNCFVNVFIYSAIYPSFRTRLKKLLSVVICCGSSSSASRVAPWTTPGTQRSTWN